MDKSAKVLMTETVALTSDRMFVEIRYKSLYMETYMVNQIISPSMKLITLAEIFICKQRNNKILTWYGRRNDTFLNWFRCCPPRVGQLVKTTVTTAVIG